MTAHLNSRPSDEAVTAGLGEWGMLVAIGTEATLFATLLASHVYLRANASEWPPNGSDPPPLSLASLGTAILIASSLVLIWSDRRARRDDLRWSRRAALATVALGAAFLVVEGVEIVQRSEGAAASAAATSLYTITGLHAAHVAVGMLMLLYVTTRMGGAADAGRHRLSSASMYWHFVDVVWVGVFLTLYVSERW